MEYKYNYIELNGLSNSLLTIDKSIFDNNNICTISLKDIILENKNIDYLNTNNLISTIKIIPKLIDNNISNNIFKYPDELIIDYVPINNDIDSIVKSLNKILNNNGFNEFDNNSIIKGLCIKKLNDSIIFENKSLYYTIDIIFENIQINFFNKILYLENSNYHLNKQSNIQLKINDNIDIDNTINIDSIKWYNYLLLKLNDMPIARLYYNVLNNDYSRCVLYDIVLNKNDNIIVTITDTNNKPIVFYQDIYICFSYFIDNFDNIVKPIDTKNNDTVESNDNETVINDCKEKDIVVECDNKKPIEEKHIVLNEPVDKSNLFPFFLNNNSTDTVNKKKRKSKNVRFNY